MTLQATVACNDRSVLQSEVFPLEDDTQPELLSLDEKQWQSQQQQQQQALRQLGVKQVCDWTACLPHLKQAPLPLTPCSSLLFMIP